MEAKVRALIETYWKCEDPELKSSPELAVALKTIIAIYFYARPFIHLGDILEATWGSMKAPDDKNGAGAGLGLSIHGRTYLCPRLRDPCICPTSLTSFHMMATTMGALPLGGTSEFTKKYMFAQPGNPGEPMDLDEVLQHFAKALKATGH